MSELLMAGPVCMLVSKQKINPTDVIQLRREVFQNGVVNANDVAILLALETACSDKCPQWDEFYISSISTYLFAQSDSGRAIGKDQVEWIVRSISRDGITETKNAFELLVYLIERAEFAPGSLCALALDQACRDIYASKANVRSVFEKDEIGCLVATLNRLEAAISRHSVHETLRARALIEIVERRALSKATADVMLVAKQELAAV